MCTKREHVTIRHNITVVIEIWLPIPNQYQKKNDRIKKTSKYTKLLLFQNL